MPDIMTIDAPNKVGRKFNSFKHIDAIARGMLIKLYRFL